MGKTEHRVHYYIVTFRMHWWGKAEEDLHTHFIRTQDIRGPLCDSGIDVLIVISYNTVFCSIHDFLCLLVILCSVSSKYMYISQQAKSKSLVPLNWNFFEMNYKMAIYIPQCFTCITLPLPSWLVKSFQSTSVGNGMDQKPLATEDVLLQEIRYKLIVGHSNPSLTYWQCSQ